MTHIAIQEQLDGKVVEWMEKVSDTQYGAPVHAQGSRSAAPARSAPGVGAQPTPAQRLIGEFSPKLVELTDKVLFGDVWARPELSQRDRSLVTVSALIAMSRPDQLRSHLARARDNGVTQEGVSCLQQALTAYECAGIGFSHSLSVERLGEAYLLADEVENARACADRAVMLACWRGERGYEAYALRLRGAIATHRDPPDVEMTEAHYHQAMALASELGMRPLVAHCHLGLGTLYRRTGNPAQAQDHLTTATAMYREMDMGFWLEKAERAEA